mmetsp:Transcript_12606/g.26532  ORF Transcript_12606/g.26532 Transcript_12606/m.26532 type:complete len:176 (+) Transcript_12606:789-1316(+)
MVGFGLAPFVVAVFSAFDAGDDFAENILNDELFLGEFGWESGFEEVDLDPGKILNVGDFFISLDFTVVLVLDSFPFLMFDLLSFEAPPKMLRVGAFVGDADGGYGVEPFDPLVMEEVPNKLKVGDFFGDEDGDDFFFGVLDMAALAFAACFDEVAKTESVGDRLTVDDDEDLTAF